MLRLKTVIQKAHQLNANETTQLEMNCRTERKVPYEEMQMTSKPLKQCSVSLDMGQCRIKCAEDANRFSLHDHLQDHKGQQALAGVQGGKPLFSVDVV